MPLWHHRNGSINQNHDMCSEKYDKMWVCGLREKTYFLLALRSVFKLGE